MRTCIIPLVLGAALPLSAMDLDGMDRFFVRGTLTTAPIASSELTANLGTGSAEVTESWRAGLEVGVARGFGIPMLGYTGSLGVLFGRSEVNEAVTLSPALTSALGYGAVQTQAALSHEDLGGQATLGATLNVTTLFHADLVAYGNYTSTSTDYTGSTLITRPGGLPVAGAISGSDDDGYSYEYGARAGAWLVLLIFEVGVVGGWGHQLHQYEYDAGLPSLFVSQPITFQSFTLSQMLGDSQREREDEGYWGGLSVGLSF